MKGFSAYLGICAAVFVIALAAGADDHGSAGHKHEGAQTEGHGVHASSANANPLIEEMQILDSVFREVVSAVSLGDGARVHSALHSMHGTMEKTHEGVRHGTVKLRKSADKLDTFVKLDKEFHGGLEKLAAAATKNDRQAMLALTKGLLDGCVTCHGMFR